MVGAGEGAENHTRPLEHPWSLISATGVPGVAGSWGGGGGTSKASHAKSISRPHSFSPSL